MKTLRFRKEAEHGFHAVLRSRVDDYFRDSKSTRFANRLFWFKASLFGSMALVSYGLIVWHPFPNVMLLPLAALYGIAVILLGINVAHDAAHGTISQYRRVNEWIQFACFTLVGVNAYLWRMRHTQSHHIFPNVNGCDIDIDENPFIRLSPNQPWRPWFRFQHLYAPLAYLLVAMHTILVIDLMYLFKRQLANLTEIRHPRREYALFVLSKVLYFTISLGIPMLVLPIPAWQIVLGYGVMTACVSIVFVFLLIGTHFSEQAEFPVVDQDGNLPYTWAEHNLVTACDWSPTSFWAHFFVGGVNAHAAHHLFPRVCSTHYRAVARLVIVTAEEFDVPYHHTNLPGIIRSHFAFLRRLGRRPEMHTTPYVSSSHTLPYPPIVSNAVSSR